MLFRALVGFVPNRLFGDLAQAALIDFVMALIAKCGDVLIRSLDPSALSMNALIGVRRDDGAVVDSA